MDDIYLCITAKSLPGESQEEFSARLSDFWTHMLRAYKEDFEKVYAETIEFEREEDRWHRQYLAEVEVVELVVSQMDAASIDHEPIDEDDRWNKYEAPADEWMQIEH